MIATGVEDSIGATIFPQSIGAAFQMTLKQFVLRSGANAALDQLVGMATGLQNKFDINVVIGSMAAATAVVETLGLNQALRLPTFQSMAVRVRLANELQILLQRLCHYLSLLSGATTSRLAKRA